MERFYLFICWNVHDSSIRSTLHVLPNWCYTLYTHSFILIHFISKRKIQHQFIGIPKAKLFITWNSDSDSNSNLSNLPTYHKSFDSVWKIQVQVQLERSLTHSDLNLNWRRLEYLMSNYWEREREMESCSRSNFLLFSLAIILINFSTQLDCIPPFLQLFGSIIHSFVHSFSVFFSFVHVVSLFSSHSVRIFLLVLVITVIYTFI